MTDPNTYSAQWFTVFGDVVDDAQTAHEVAFLRRQLPVARYARVLDICFASGRHTSALAASGYHITAIDKDTAHVNRLKAQLPAQHAVHCLDIRELNRLDGPFDGALCLWQSFGFFNTATNKKILHDVAAILAPGGRLVLDLYNRAFFETHQGTRTIEKNSRTVTETKTMTGDRLTVTLDYDDGAQDIFDWQLYTTEALHTVANECDFRVILACTTFDEKEAPSDEMPRAQYILEKA